MPRIYVKQDLKKRFLSKIEKNESGCHLWKSVVTVNGVGMFSNNGKYHQAHRFSYGLFVGDPGKSWVKHKCRNRLCVNPDHLFLSNEKPKLKITVEKESQIYSLYSLGYEKKKIAEMIGVSLRTVVRYAKKEIERRQVYGN